MKTVYVIITILILSIVEARAQNITCTELLNFVEENGYKKGEVSSLQLYDSSWLKSVEAYQYKNTIFVVAEIKADDFGFSTQKYIFCGIPLRNWESFENAWLDTESSYGKKFQKYIINYKCSCN